MTEGLFRFGYTERETAFLRLASLLSGYFLRNHFNWFIGKKNGALAQRFIDRGLQLGHLKALPCPWGRIVYHVAGSPIYSALGDEHNRNRRAHRPETMRLRLMALDFALLKSETSWLLTEAEKATFFSKLGIVATDLPGIVFGGSTRRLFVEKLPISCSDLGVPSFAFIDGGSQAFSQWRLFLQGHRALLQHLNSAVVVFASCHASRFALAERLFRRIVVGETVSGCIDIERLRNFFISRRRFEEKRYESFDQKRLDELRENKRVFAGPDFEQLYESWRVRGDSELVGLKAARVTFRPVALPRLYEWLSPIQTYERRA